MEKYLAFVVVIPLLAAWISEYIERKKEKE